METVSFSEFSCFFWSLGRTGRSQGSTNRSSNGYLEWFATDVYMTRCEVMDSSRSPHEILYSSEGILRIFINLDQSSFEAQSLREDSIMT